MYQQESGIDKFQMSWELLKRIEVNEGNEVWEFVREKDTGEPLKDFFIDNVKEQNEYVVIPKFKINGIDLAFWLNLNIVRGKYIDYVGGIFNSFFTGYALLEEVPFIKLLLLQFQGEKISEENLKRLGFGINNPDFNFQLFIEQENKDVPLYICGCGDRICGSISVEILKEESLISWKGLNNMRPFTFDFLEYKKEFKELIALVNDNFF